MIILRESRSVPGFALSVGQSIDEQLAWPLEGCTALLRQQANILYDMNEPIRNRKR